MANGRGCEYAKLAKRKRTEAKIKNLFTFSLLENKFFLPYPEFLACPVQISSFSQPMHSKMFFFKSSQCSGKRLFSHFFNSPTIFILCQCKALQSHCQQRKAFHLFSHNVDSARLFTSSVTLSTVKGSSLSSVTLVNSVRLFSNTCQQCKALQSHCKQCKALQLHLSTV
jgi:hypothetical protein